jgi:hypothetical protein
MGNNACRLESSRCDFFSICNHVFTISHLLAQVDISISMDALSSTLVNSNCYLSHPSLVYIYFNLENYEIIKDFFLFSTDQVASPLSLFKRKILKYILVSIHCFLLGCRALNLSFDTILLQCHIIQVIPWLAIVGYPIGLKVLCSVHSSKQVYFDWRTCSLCYHIVGKGIGANFVSYFFFQDENSNAY